MAKTAHFSAILVCFALYVGQTSTVSGEDLLKVPPCAAEFKRGVLNGALPPCVENLQKGLKLLKTPGLVVDGLFGENTESSVKFFQRTEGLVEDGWVGPLTRAKLNEKYEKKTPPTPTPSRTPGSTTTNNLSCRCEVRKCCAVCKLPWISNEACQTYCNTIDCGGGSCVNGICTCSRCASGSNVEVSVG